MKSKKNNYFLRKEIMVMDMKSIKHTCTCAYTLKRKTERKTNRNKQGVVNCRGKTPRVNKKAPGQHDRNRAI